MEKESNNSIPAHIFKAYDIRGLVGTEVTEEVGYRVGQALVQFTGARKVVVGHDMRDTSPAISAAVIEGVQSQGAEAVFIGGDVATPMMYFAVASDESYDAGIIVTASHNPAEYNGMKLVRGNVQPIGGATGMDVIRDAVLEGRIDEVAEKGGYSETDVKEAYLNKIFAKFGDLKDFGVHAVVDSGNGMEGVLIEDVFARLPNAKFEGMYLELDGNFPNHEANPLKVETLDALRKRVVEVGADIGIAYDGDADRIGIIDETGEPVPGDLLLALVAPIVLENNSGGKVVYDVRCSMVVAEEVEKAGGVTFMYKVGHGLIKPFMLENDCIFAGELSQHYYFKEFEYAEAPDFLLLMVFDLMKRTGKTLSELVAPLRRYAHSGEINSEVEDKDAVMKKFREMYEENESAYISDVDGIRVDIGTEDGKGNWWFSVRASNTEPLLRLNVEAKDPELMEQKRDELLKIIRE